MGRRRERFLEIESSSSPESVKAELPQATVRALPTSSRSSITLLLILDLYVYY